MILDLEESLKGLDFLSHFNSEMESFLNMLVTVAGEVLEEMDDSLPAGNKERSFEAG